MNQKKQNKWCNTYSHKVCANIVFLFFMFFYLFVTNVMAENCQIKKIVWIGEHYENDDAYMDPVVGKSCDAWESFKDKLISYYENHGFVAVKVHGYIDSSNILILQVNRGLGWVWAHPENLDSSGTKPEVFRRLSGIEMGSPVSLVNLERAERKLARVGYFEQTSLTRLFRDSSRNRIIPAFSMRKANVSEMEGIIAYSSDENSWEGLLNVSLYNIAGTARDLFLEGFVGENSRHVEGYYKEPWVFGSSWNVIVRGSFDEEMIDGELLDRLVVGEMGVTREMGFDFTIGAYLGLSEDDKRSSFEIKYISQDRFILPRSGWRLDGSLTWKFNRADSLDNHLNAYAQVVALFPLYKNFIARYRGVSGGIFPTNADLKRSDFFALGGMDDFKGMQYHVLRSRAYGLSELALMWQDGNDLSIEIFYQPGLYRRQFPEHDWGREQNYGVGFIQYRKNWSVNLYYALRNGCAYLEGILGFGVKTLF